MKTLPLCLASQLLLAGSIVLGQGLLSVALAASQSPHQHGAGALNVVVDGSDLALEVRLPAIDVIGFEHEPRNEEQTQKAKQALASFKEARLWFEPSPQASCVVESVQASVVGLSIGPNPDSPDLKPAHSDEHKHDHKHDHKHEKKQGHSGEHKHQHADEEAHADFEGVMQFHCDSPSDLSQLNVLLFEQFPAVETVDVQLVTPTVQSKRRLSKQQSTLDLSQ